MGNTAGPSQAGELHRFKTSIPEARRPTACRWQSGRSGKWHFYRQLDRWRIWTVFRQCNGQERCQRNLPLHCGWDTPYWPTYERFRRLRYSRGYRFENSLNEKTNSVVFPASGASSSPGCALRASECAPTGDRRRGAEYGCTRIEPHHPRLQPSCQCRALHELCDHVHRCNAGNGVLDRNTDRAGWNNYLRWNTRPIHELGRMGCRGEFRLHHHALEWRELGSVLHLSGGKWWRRRRGSHQPELAHWTAEPRSGSQFTVTPSGTNLNIAANNPGGGTINAPLVATSSTTSAFIVQGLPLGNGNADVTSCPYTVQADTTGPATTVDRGTVIEVNSRAPAQSL